jgi:hypothetical protein
MASDAYGGSKIGYLFHGLAQSSVKTDEQNMVGPSLGILLEETCERKNASF